MPRTMVTADLHLGHRLMGRVRPLGDADEHDEEIYRRFKDATCKSDIVYMLGDVAWNGAGLWKLARFRLCVQKMVLIPGNHDNYPVHRYIDAGFDDVRGCVQAGAAILTHIPLHPEQLGRWPINVHGHLHARAMEDSRYVCVSLEQTDYRPVALDDVLAYVTEVTEGK